MIKCRTKQLAREAIKKINKEGIYCKPFGHSSIYAFKTSTDEDQAYKILKEAK